MKLISTFTLFALMTIASQAATIKWGGSGYAYYGNTELVSGASTAYLVYLGENASDWSGFDFASDFNDSKLAHKDTTALGAIGSNNQFGVTIGNALGGEGGVTDVLKDGKSSFGVLFTTTQGGTDYYYLGDVFTFDTSSSNYKTGTSTYTATSTAAPGQNATWTAVPEPATGALALAGVALLFRRRRA